MQLDRKSVDRLLRLDDRQLRQLIDRLAAEAGIDASALGVSTADLGALRAALGQASDGELAELARTIEGARSRSGGGGKGGQ